MSVGNLDRANSGGAFVTAVSCFTGTSAAQSNGQYLANWARVGRFVPRLASRTAANRPGISISTSVRPREDFPVV